MSADPDAHLAAGVGAKVRNSTSTLPKNMLPTIFKSDLLLLNSLPQCLALNWLNDESSRSADVWFGNYGGVTGVKISALQDDVVLISMGWEGSNPKPRAYVSYATAEAMEGYNLGHGDDEPYDQILRVVKELTKFPPGRAQRRNWDGTIITPSNHGALRLQVWSQEKAMATYHLDDTAQWAAAKGAKSKPPASSQVNVERARRMGVADTDRIGQVQQKTGVILGQLVTLKKVTEGQYVEFDRRIKAAKATVVGLRAELDRVLSDLELCEYALTEDVDPDVGDDAQGPPGEAVSPPEAVLGGSRRQLRHRPATRQRGAQHLMGAS